MIAALVDLSWRHTLLALSLSEPRKIFEDLKVYGGTGSRCSLLALFHTQGLKMKGGGVFLFMPKQLTRDRYLRGTEVSFIFSGAESPEPKGWCRRGAVGCSCPLSPTRIVLSARCAAAEAF